MSRSDQMQPKGAQNIRRLAIAVGIFLMVLCVSWFSAPACKGLCLSLIFDWIESAVFAIATGGLVSSVLIEGFEESARYWAPAVLAIEGLAILTGIIFARIQSCGLTCPPGAVFLFSELVLFILNPILAVATLLHLSPKTA